MTGLYGDFLADMPSAPSCAESCLTELIDAVQQLRRVQRFHSHQRWCSPVAELLTAGQEGPGIPLTSSSGTRKVKAAEEGGGPCRRNVTGLPALRPSEQHQTYWTAAFLLLITQHT